MGRDRSLFSPSASTPSGSTLQIPEGCASQIPSGSVSQISSPLTLAPSSQQVFVDVDTYVSSPTSIAFPSAGSSPLLKRKRDLPPLFIVKRGRTRGDVTDIPTSFGTMAPMPLDSNVQASSILHNKSSLNSLAIFSRTNPYIIRKIPQAPRPTLPPRSEAFLNWIHSLRRKGLEESPTSMQGSTVKLSFPAMVDNIEGGLAALILDSIPREEDCRLAEGCSSTF